ncbi:uncharacterized protein RSE6_06590 [Rhynchosporium secalis]|uniref:Uncharacterized protein n=1 Tax=Rhynchosporium secalis TaxID=38038 RepID=A0A1E1MAP4_RHYSE|nr:uncharacterized protein RSE6_06590 [Rhynchosporium secalis]
MDDFYKPLTSTDTLPLGLLSKLWHSIPIPPALLATLLLGPLLIFLIAQILLIRAPADPEKEDKGTEDNLWMIPFQPVPWPVQESGLNACNRLILSEPHQSVVLESVIENLQRNIPQMISFISTPIDHQPWEQHAQAHFISSSTTEINLVSLLRDMTSHALIPAVFGYALLEKHPGVLHDMYDMNAGRPYLLRKLPAWTPWPGVVKAHMARFRVWRCLDELQRVLDSTVEGKESDASWGDLEDVSEFAWKRNAVYREHGFEIKERADIIILHSLLTSPTLLPIWQILHILSTPDILPLIRTEIASYATVTKPFSIGTISEAPKLVLDLEGLVKTCPLLRSTFLETLRLVAPGWNGVNAGTGEEKGNVEIAFPETFDAKRFVTSTLRSSTATEGGGCGEVSESYSFIEQTNLALVAGILVFWDFEPADKSTGWILPEKLRRGGIAMPNCDVRVLVRRRRFEWTN